MVESVFRVLEVVGVSNEINRLAKEFAEDKARPLGIHIRSRINAFTGLSPNVEQDQASNELTSELDHSVEAEHLKPRFNIHW